MKLHLLPCTVVPLKQLMEKETSKISLGICLTNSYSHLCLHIHINTERKQSWQAYFQMVDGKDLWCLKSSQGNEEQDVFRQRLIALLLCSEHSAAATTTVLMTHWWQRVNQCVIFQGHRLTGSESDHQPEHWSGEENKTFSSYHLLQPSESDTVLEGKVIEL